MGQERATLLRRRIAPMLTAGLFAWTFAVSLLWAQEPEWPKRPNVVLIIGDDLGYTDLGCYGSGFYETPHIDRLAAEGVRFTQGYTAGPNCQPTRAAIFSGQYTPRTGVYTVGSIDRFNWQSRPLRPVDNVTELPLTCRTLGQVMKEGGYRTGYFGKWHLGDKEPYHPHFRGFDEAIVSAGQHFDFVTRPRVEYPPGTYLADFLTDRSIQFIRRHAGNSPFFLVLAHFVVHSPYDAKEELVKHFRGKAPVGGHYDPVYAAMIASLDESVGRVVETIDQLGLGEKTLIIFTSDNGGVGGYGREGIAARDVTDNAPLRGGKGMLYEGGIRVPFIFRWKGVIPAGRICHQLIHSVDFFPTFIALAGVPVPPNYPLDGLNILPLLVDPGRSDWPERALFWHFPGYLGAGKNTWRTTPVGVIRKGPWKLMEFFEDGRLELYNLAEDVGERENLAAKLPEKVADLHAELLAWRKRVGAPMPTPNRPGKLSSLPGRQTSVSVE
ncbi:MAG: sulfatase [Thermoguttaceae bacterium]|nr:sulfatase [Thermoguttaceae bacterium]MDW8078611.1 sulfatase [Thermoguttaceae bacterium]